MRSFTYTGLPARVLFGFGTIAALPEEMKRLGCRRALLLSTPGQETKLRDLASRISAQVAGIFPAAVMHTPVEVSERAVATAGEVGADCIVALGGGSAIGLGKAIALRTDLPQICIPTTYAGSEMTPILGETAAGIKTTQRLEKVLPETVIYDVDLTLALPPAVSAASGMNAIAHAAEALYAQDRNPVISLMAEEGARALAHALPRIVENGGNASARADALYGAWLCGTCLGAVGMALHHKLCHVLGGTFNLPHAETHSVVLPHAVAYNAPAAPEAMTTLARALGGSDPARSLFDLARRLGVPRALKDLGMPQDGIDKACEQALKNPYWNPRPLERDGIRALIARAWAGEAPTI